MKLVPRDLELSRRRAHLRDRVLLDVATHRVRTLGEIAKSTRIRPSRVLGILEGDGKEYAYDLSLLHQGAVRRHGIFGGQVYAITPEGAQEVIRSAKYAV